MYVALATGNVPRTAIAPVSASTSTIFNAFGWLPLLAPMYPICFAPPNAASAPAARADTTVIFLMRTF